MKKEIKNLLLFFSCLLSALQLAAWPTPSQSSPTNGNTTWTGVTINWNSVSSSQQYQMQIDTVPTFNSAALVSVTKTYINTVSSNSDTEHYMTLRFGQTYYWRVRAYVPADTSAWSSTWNFTTRDYVTMSSPNNTSSWVGAYLNWAPHTGVSFYDVQADTSPNFNSSLLRSATNGYINSTDGNSDTYHYPSNLHFGKTYYWRVRARNAVDTSSWSASWTFTTNDYVTMSSPNNTSSWVGAYLNWAPHNGVSFYDVQADTSPNFNSPLLRSATNAYINSTDGNSDTYNYPTNLHFGKTYYWRVRARNAVDTSTWSGNWTFTTNDYVTMSSPNNVATWVGAYLNWAPHNGVSFYDVQTDTSPNFNSTLLRSATNAYINSTDGNSDTYNYPTNLHFGKTYYWRVRARNAADTSSWSASWTYTTNDYVTMTSPNNTSSWVGAYLNWAPHNGVGFYDVQADTSPNFNSPLLSVATKNYINSTDGNSDTYHYPTDLHFGKNYYWRVRARNAVDTSSWLVVWPFSTRDYVTLFSPNDGQLSVSVAGITLNWDPHVGVSLYQLQIDTVPSFNSTALQTVNKAYINSTNGNSDTQHATGALLANTVYYWRVRSMNTTIDTCAWTTRYFSTGTCGVAGAISGNATVCQSSSNSYSIAAVVGATSYTWTLPSGWTGSSTTNSISVVPNGSNGSISVTANTTCGTFSPQTYIVNVNPVPAQPAAISGNTSICQTVSETYSITPVAGATSYTWTLPAGWTGSSTTNSINVTGSGSGSISVTANNTCGSSTVRTIPITVNPVPAQPTAISGNATVCLTTAQTYSITPVAGATSYTWTLPSGWTGSSITNSINVTSGNTGSISVTANNVCGNSTVQTLSVTSNTTPAQPTAISGNATVCQTSAQTYSITNVAGATSYTWTLPSGWTGSSTTNSINVTAANTGAISVTANNTCGNSTVQILNVTTNTAPAQPAAIAGNTTICQAVSETYSITAVPGATSYTWTLPAGWTGSSTTNSINVTGSGSGSISVTANNTCGSSTVRTIPVTVNPVPAQPAAIAGNATVCLNAAETYSITAVPGATSYTWTLPAGWTGSSTTNSINVTSGNTGAISVTANNTCGSSTVRILNITTNTIPSQPVSISGNTTVCQASAQPYSITAVPGATSYTWTLPSGWTGSSTTNSINTTVANSGAISVTANNTCGISTVQILNVTANVAPAQPAAIAGNTTICQTVSETYSITPVSGATSYTWSLPAGWTGSSTTNSINVTGSNSGSISVTANNACGSSIVQTIPVTVNPVPAQPAAIAGNATVCLNTAETYSITAVPGATSYTWTLPSGWTGSSTTNSINVTSGNTGAISVTANNACGSSTVQILNITTNTAPAQPAAISGNATICDGTTQIYTINPVAGATSYTWTLPAGWNGTSTTNNISISTDGTNGAISVTADNTCGSSAVQILNINSDVTPAQPASILGNASVCSTISETYSIPSVSGASAYTWTLPLGWTGSSTTNSISVTGSNSGVISVTADNVCGSSTVQTLNITVNTVNTGVTVSNNTLTADAATATYQWVDCNNGNAPIVNEIGQSFSPVVNGNYAVIVTENGCSEISNCFQITIVGLEQTPSTSNMRLFPNPSEGAFSIDLGSHLEEVQVQITDMFGQLVQDVYFNKSNLININLLEIPSGVYLVSVKSKDQSLQTFKFVKQ